MPRTFALLLATSLTAGLGSVAPAPAEPGMPPGSCQGAFATRGACLLVVAGVGDPVTLSVSGIAYGATEARIDIRVEDAATGATIVRCSAERVQTPAEVACQMDTTVVLAEPLVARCVVDGLLAGRFFCDTW